MAAPDENYMIRFRKGISVRAAFQLTWIVLLSCDNAPDRFSSDWLENSGVPVVAISEPRSELIGHVDLEIGGTEGASPEVFSRIGGLLIDGSERIVVVDQLDDEVRIFSPDGQFEFSFGRSGSGPGEMRNPCCPAIGPDGLLWIRDNGNARYNAYQLGRSAAIYMNTIRASAGGGAVPVPLTFTNGRIVDITTSWGRVGPEYTRHQLDRDGNPIHSIRIEFPLGRVPHATYSMSSSPLRKQDGVVFPIYGARHQIAHSPAGDWAEVVTSDYLILWHSANGEVVRAVQRDMPTVALSRAERQEERRHAKQFPSIALPLSEWKPRVFDILFDQSGRLWVLLPVSDGMCHADVIDPDGSLAATARWPCYVDLRRGYISRATALGIRRDRLGVEKVVRVGMEVIPSAK